MFNKKPLPPIKGALDSKPKVGGFKPHQVAEDTERQLMGKPQMHGAAMPDDDPHASEAPAPKPGLASAVPPPVQGEGDGEGGNDIESLKAENAELHSRLDAIEQHLGIKKKEDAPGAPSHDDSPISDDDGGY